MALDFVEGETAMRADLGVATKKAEAKLPIVEKLEAAKGLVSIIESVGESVSDVSSLTSNLHIN